MSNIKDVTSENFDELVAKSDKPVLLDFWATWCGPCKMIAPILDEVSAERKDVVVLKADVDVNQELAKKFGVRGVPTLLLLDKGKVMASKVGATSKGALNTWIDTIID